MPDFSLESAGPGLVAGVDEAGRGPWAGPVVAAAVVFDTRALPRELADGLDDSKRLSRAKREALFALIPACASVGVGVADVAEIDRHNILQATLTAMTRAVRALDCVPARVLVDGNRVPDLDCAAACVIKGDAKSFSIAAASIVAKVSRDKTMAELAAAFPGYGWERNAGYGTAEHKAAMLRLGVTPHHRRSFTPVRKILGSI